MENEQGLLRKFTINWDEKLLQGRGIKGFFSPYAEGLLLIAYTADSKITVTGQNRSLPDDVASTLHYKERAHTVMDSLAVFANNFA